MSKLPELRYFREVLTADDQDLTDLQAQFSLAYVRAVAAVAGYFAAERDRGADKDGIDMEIHRRGPKGLTRSPRLEIQVKSERRDAPTDDTFSYKLKAKNFNDLCSSGLVELVPRILVLVLVPTDLTTWMGHSEAELALRHCGYWANLANEKPLANGVTSKAIHISRLNIFSPHALDIIMCRISNLEAV